MEIFEKMLQKTISYKGTTGVYRGYKLQVCQYFRYRRILNRIENLPKVENDETRSELTRLKAVLVRSLSHNFRDINAKREFWELNLSELLNLCSYMISGTDDDCLEQQLHQLDERETILAIMRAFPSYKLEDFPMMRVEVFYTLYQLATTCQAEAAN